MKKPKLYKCWDKKKHVWYFKERFRFHTEVGTSWSGCHRFEFTSIRDVKRAILENVRELKRQRNAKKNHLQFYDKGLLWTSKSNSTKWVSEHSP